MEKGIQISNEGRYAVHTMRRGYCSKLSEQIENLDHNKRAILRYEKQESITFDLTRPAGRPNPWTVLL
jgi:hypothetical protein